MYSFTQITGFLELQQISFEPQPSSQLEILTSLLPGVLFKHPCLLRAHSYALLAARSGNSSAELPFQRAIPYKPQRDTAWSKGYC